MDKLAVTLRQIEVLHPNTAYAVTLVITREDSLLGIQSSIPLTIDEVTQFVADINADASA